MTKNKSKVLTRFNVSDFKLLLHLLMRLFHRFNLSVVYYQEDRKNTWNQMEIHMFVFTRKKKQIIKEEVKEEIGSTWIFPRH